jgi:hypothetical protein
MYTAKDSVHDLTYRNDVSKLLWVEVNASTNLYNDRGNKLN